MSEPLIENASTWTADEVRRLSGPQEIEQFAKGQLQKLYSNYKTIAQIEYNQAKTRVERGSTDPKDVLIVLQGVE